jgi:hypothetical protein
MPTRTTNILALVFFNDRYLAGCDYFLRRERERRSARVHYIIYSQTSRVIYGFIRGIKKFANFFSNIFVISSHAVNVIPHVMKVPLHAAQIPLHAVL